MIVFFGTRNGTSFGSKVAEVLQGKFGLPQTERCRTGRRFCAKVLKPKQLITVAVMIKATERARVNLNQTVLFLCELIMLVWDAFGVLRQTVDSKFEIPDFKFQISNMAERVGFEPTE